MGFIDWLFNRHEKKITQEELLDRIHTRLGWIMFWIIFLGLSIVAFLPE